MELLKKKESDGSNTITLDVLKKRLKIELIEKSHKDILTKLKELDEECKKEFVENKSNYFNSSDKLSSINIKLSSVENFKKDIEKRLSAIEKTLLDIKTNTIKNGSVINITNSASIEKDKSIEKGSIYFNSKKGFRVKDTNGWFNVKLDK